MVLCFKRVCVCLSLILSICYIYKRTSNTHTHTYKYTHTQSIKPAHKFFLGMRKPWENVVLFYQGPIDTRKSEIVWAIFDFLPPVEPSRLNCYVTFGKFENIRPVWIQNFIQQFCGAEQASTREKLVWCLLLGVLVSTDITRLMSGVKCNKGDALDELTMKMTITTTTTRTLSRWNQQKNNININMFINIK